MSLPLPVVPEYELTLPVSKKVIRYRPFLVKEEKILLLANESGDLEQVAIAIDQVLTNCTFGKENVAKLPTADLEYLFLKVRSVSIGETVDVEFICPHCENKQNYTIKLDDVSVENNVEEKTIKIAENIILTMTFPTRASFIDIKATDENELKIQTAARCIEMLTIDDQVYMAKDMPIEELVAYVEYLTIPQKNTIMEFLDKLPYVIYADKIKCNKCGVETEFALQGLYDFFV